MLMISQVWSAESSAPSAFPHVLNIIWLLYYMGQISAPLKPWDVTCYRSVTQGHLHRLFVKYCHPKLGNHDISNQGSSCRYMNVFVVFRIQIETSGQISVLRLSNLSSLDHNSKISCTAENIVGEKESSLLLDILCTSVLNKCRI